MKSSGGGDGSWVGAWANILASIGVYIPLLLKLGLTGGACGCGIDVYAESGEACARPEGDGAWGELELGSGNPPTEASSAKISPNSPALCQLECINQFSACSDFATSLLQRCGSPIFTQPHDLHALLDIHHLAARIRHHAHALTAPHVEQQRDARGERRQLRGL
ncbi:hypothetical protein B0H16DRAFT_1527553 [Mycena metata]|uniref:Uncharacterized protein n=1 Tax=Mycena metata TaxID=1033252 RepID=A0AAD7JEQ6_9AGAR|nr:hypothetical protein B0H16DRAFT_1527553 [Mycena metata]